MNTIDAIRTRRSVRAWTDQNIPDDMLTQILEAGRWSPSPLNSQPWHFIVVRKKETLAAKVLEKKLPFNINNKFSEIFREYQNQKTIESKFAKAVNVLDPIILGLDHKAKWKGLSEEFLYRHKEGTLIEFPVMREYFHALMDYCESEGYFNQ